MIAVKGLQDVLGGNVLLAFAALPILLSVNGNISLKLSHAVVFGYGCTLLLIGLYYWLRAPKSNAFALPLCFVVFPFFLCGMMFGMRYLLPIRSDPGGWEILSVFVALYHSFPLAFLTGMASFFMKRRGSGKRTK